MIGIWMLTTKNQPFLISKDDYEFVCKYKWHYSVTHKETVTKRAYIKIETIVKGKHLLLHRVIVSPKKGHVVDHINKDTLDNRRENLRAVTQKENTQNMRTRKNKTKGISFDSKRKKWHAYQDDPLKGRIFIGYFDTKDEAQKARDL